MPRKARVKMDNAIYHVTSRGDNKEPIFFSDDDKIRYLDSLKIVKEKFQIEIYAYCLMDNHTHLIIDSKGQDISKIMQSINLRHTIYINRVYNRSGHLFGGRFWSEIIDNDKYLLECTRYTHDNPVRAGITKTTKEYKWSSFDIYIGQRDIRKIINDNVVLRYFSENKSRARELYIEFQDEECEEYKPKYNQDKYESSDKKVIQKGTDINSVVKKVSVCFGVCINEITLKNNKKYSKERKIAIYLSSLKSRLTYEEIGKKFGICGSAIGQNIKKGVELVINNTEIKRYFDLILQA